jgi:predicted membrane chloride channel (bestrophin family)
MAKDRANIFTNRYEDTENPGQGFWKMMLVWHGSVFKLIWIHLTVFILAFAGLGILYRNVFMANEEQREIFELICIYCSRSFSWPFER